MVLVYWNDSSFYLWSGCSQSNVFSFTMLARRALLGKKRARSVARMQCFMLLITALYSSGCKLPSKLFCSCQKFQFQLISDYRTPVVGWRPPSQSGDFPSLKLRTSQTMGKKCRSWTCCWNLWKWKCGHWQLVRLEMKTTVLVSNKRFVDFYWT